MPEHGTRAAYQAGCKCFACRLNESRYQEQWRERKASGTSSRLPTLTAQVRLARLTRGGWSLRQIAKATGCSIESLMNVRDGKYATTQRKVADPLLRLPTDPASKCDPWSYIPAASTHERIGQMHRQGFSKNWIASQIGGTIPKPGAAHVRRWKADAIADLADFIGDGGLGMTMNGRKLGKSALPQSERSRLANAS